jgi:hypothetical protein
MNYEFTTYTPPVNSLNEEHEAMLKFVPVKARSGIRSDIKVLVKQLVFLQRALNNHNHHYEPKEILQIKAEYCQAQLSSVENYLKQKSASISTPLCP